DVVTDDAQRSDQEGLFPPFAVIEQKPEGEHAGQAHGVGVEVGVARGADEAQLSAELLEAVSARAEFGVGAAEAFGQADAGDGFGAGANGDERSTHDQDKNAAVQDFAVVDGDEPEQEQDDDVAAPRELLVGDLRVVHERQRQRDAEDEDDADERERVNQAL